MADVNWKKYNCDICRAIGFVLAGIAAGLLIWLLAKASMPVWLLAILFLIAWAVLFYLVDRQCEARADSYESAAAPAAAATAAAASHSAPVAHTEGDAAAKGAVETGEQKAAAEAAEAEAAAAEQETADAERRAAEERAAAEKIAAEKAIADEAERKAEADRAAALEAERKAAEERAMAEKAAAEAARKAAEAKSNDEQAARDAEAARATAAGETDYDGDGTAEGAYEGTRPEALDGPRGGTADDLKRIKGIGPKLEILCNTLGFYHFDQISKWTLTEVAWVDANLEGFKGRVTRDEWVRQAGVLAEGGETEFSKRVDDGDVPSSQ